MFAGGMKSVPPRHTNDRLENGFKYLYYAFHCNVINTSPTYTKYKT